MNRILLLAQVDLFPQSASTFADEVDALYLFLVAVSGFFTLLIAGLILLFAIRYRRSVRPAYPEQVVGWWSLELFWAGVPLILVMIFFFWGASLFVRQSLPPSDTMDIYVVGKQWMWKIQHPGGRREINQLHVPVHQPIKLVMTSQDVIHSFYVPQFRTKQDVLPGRFTTLWFEATQTGRFYLFCAEYCGTDHSGMIGEVVVLEPSEFQRWLQLGRDDTPLSIRGRDLYLQHRCYVCHEEQEGLRRGPSLVDRFGRPVQQADGRLLTFDEQYVTESIRSPRAHVTAGFEPIMPAFPREQLNEMDLTAIIQYLRVRRE